MAETYRVGYFRFRAGLVLAEVRASSDPVHTIRRVPAPLSARPPPDLASSRRRSPHAGLPTRTAPCRRLARRVRFTEEAPASSSPSTGRFRPGMAGDDEGLAASLGELRVEPSPSPSRESEVAPHGNGDDIVDDDVWDDDASDSPGRGSVLDREWAYRQNQFRKMGYRDGITEGQKDAAQEGFNIGFRESVHIGYRWGLVRGVTSALASLPDRLKEKLLPSDQCRVRLQSLHNSVQEISADDALQMFHESTLDNNRPLEEPHVKSEEGEADSSRLETLPKNLLLLLHECPNIKVHEEMA